MGVGNAARPVAQLMATKLVIVVDRDLCEGNARCVQTAPEVFEVDDRDQVVVLVDEVTDELREAVETAVALCPRQALRLGEA
jgi:ferredoxin